MSTAAAARPTLGIAPKSAVAAGLAWGASRVLKSGLLLGAVVSALLAVWILVGLGGFDYYRTPVSVRAYAPAHRLLRPSGPAGQMFGVIGLLMMLMPFAYAARKKVKALKNTGPIRVWLEVHLFCGIVGPVLVTFHTAFRFNGLVSAAYWSMVLVVLSGFVGRYLYARIPRTIRGVELTRAELDARAEQLRDELAGSIPSEALRRRIETFERGVQPNQPSFLDLMLGEFVVGRRVRALDLALAGAELPADLRKQSVMVAVERAMLLRRVTYLEKTKRLFALWHVFHMPLVYLLMIIAAAHVALAFYLGYVPFRW